MSTLLSFVTQFTDKAQPRVHSYATNVNSTQTFRAVAKQASSLRQQLSQLAGARVALTMTASSDVLTTLVALDGLVEELIVLPVDVNVPPGCHFHINERGTLRELEPWSANPMPVQTGWSLRDEQGHLVSFTLAELCNNPLVASGNRDKPLRWGVLQEPAQLAGLMVWLRALKHGEDIVLAQADNLSALAQMFAHAGVTAIAAPPRLWRSLLASNEPLRLPLQLAIVNSAMADATTLQRIQYSFSGVHVAHAFSHTGAGYSWLVRDGEPGFPAQLMQVSDAPVKLKVEDDSLLVELGESGARIQTDYVVERNSKGRVVIIGERSHKVNVGGRDVFVQQVEHALLAVPGVVDVQAGSMPNPVLGELIRVDVLAPQHRTVAERKAFKRQLQDHCRAVLQPWQRPARYDFHG